MPATLNQRVPCSEFLIPTFFFKADPDPRGRITDLDPSMRRELLEKFDEDVENVLKTFPYIVPVNV
jgi:hypothetical protein